MSMTKIVTSGVTLINEMLTSGGTIDGNQMVFAYIPGLDVHQAPADATTIPTGYISHTADVTRKAKVDQDTVVYSVNMDTTIGDFDFNWQGLVQNIGGVKTLIAAAHMPTQYKRKKIDNVQEGNNITRNFALKFAGAANVTGITIAPETWQFDFTEEFIQMGIAIIDNQNRCLNNAMAIMELKLQ